MAIYRSKSCVEFSCVSIEWSVTFIGLISDPIFPGKRSDVSARERRTRQGRVSFAGPRFYGRTTYGSSTMVLLDSAGLPHARA